MPRTKRTLLNLTSLLAITSLGHAAPQGAPVPAGDAPPAMDNHGYVGLPPGNGSAAEAVPASLRDTPFAGLTVLRRGMPEKQVRAAIAKGTPGDLFIVEPGAAWVLSATLKIPNGVTIYGTNPGGPTEPKFTFQKGFNGPLATIAKFVTLHGLYFDGNKGSFKGDVLRFGRRLDFF